MDVIREIEGLPTKEEVYKLLGTSRTAIQNHKTRGTVPHDKIVIYCLKHNVNINHLLTGNHPPSSNQPPQLRESTEDSLSDSQKDQMIDMQGKLIKSLEAEIEKLKAINLESQKGQGRQESSA